MIRISVIIPVYKVERYIERCVRSLFEQTIMNEIEYIIVNDCTPDNSMKIVERVLNEYPFRKKQVRILNNEKNLGSAGARLIGMKAAAGEYMIHCDPDDWVDRTFYADILENICKFHADIISCDYTVELGHNSSERLFESYEHPHDRIKNMNKFSWSLCCTAVKSSIIKEHQIFPIIGVNMTEDMNVLVRAHYYANSIAYMRGSKYHYRMNSENSIVKASSHSAQLMVQQRSSIQIISDFLDKYNFDAGVGLLMLKQNTRDKFLLVRNFKEWRKTFPEVVPFVLSMQNVAFLYKICYAVAAKGLFFPLKAYMYLSKIIHSH